MRRHGGKLFPLLKVIILMTLVTCILGCAVSVGGPGRQKLVVGLLQVARSVERLPTFVAPPFVGAARPHTPRLPPLPWGLTPTGSRHDLGITYAYGRITMATKRSERSQRRLDNPLKNGILRNQVA